MKKARKHQTISDTEDVLESPRIERPEPYPQAGIMQEIDYNEVNTQLKFKLLEFKKCNEQNIAKAKQEIGRLAIYIKTVKSNNEILWEQLEQIRKKIIIEEQKLTYKEDTKSENHRPYLLMRKVLAMFYNSIQSLKKEKVVKRRHNLRVLMLHLQIWKEVYLIRQLIKQKNIARGNVLLKKAIYCLRLYVDKIHTLNKKYTKILVSRLGYKTLLGLKIMHYKVVKKKQRMKLLINFRNKNIFRRVIRGFSDEMVGNNLPIKLEREFTKKVIKV